MTSLYVAGPMTGHPNYNFPAFFEATARLRAQGFEVISPAEHDIEMDWVKVQYDSWGGLLSATKRDGGAFDWATALDWDLKAIDGCVGIYLLPGWSKSRGACKEYEHAVATRKVILGATHETPAAVVQHQPLVGLTGYAQAGKDTFAGLLGYNRIAFADKLKELALACNPEFTVITGTATATGGQHVTLTTRRNLSTIVADMGWEYAKAEVPGVREFLQNLGVGVRDVLGDDTWVRAAFRSYDPALPTVFTDVRFPNEIEAIRERGGVTARIDRDSVSAVNGHVSEFAWQASEPDHVVTNNAGISALAARARVFNILLRKAT